MGPTRLLSTSFGYSVAYREVQHGDTATISIGLFLYDRGRWIRSPLRLGKDISGIDDVAFSDRLHGWVAAYDCARATVFLYRTSDGGRSWRSLGGPATHSCGGGPTYLSFVDRTRGWMEPVSPNGPAGELLGTADGGSTWTLRSALHDRLPALPCLAPIEFLTRSLGWMARCGGDVFVTHDAGRRWGRISIGRGRAFYDVPRFAGRHGVIAATRGAATSTSVTFLVTNDGVGNGHASNQLPNRFANSDPRHAFIHVAWGAVMLVLAGRGMSDRGYARLTLAFGVFYTALAVLGLAVHHPFDLRLDRGENVFHLLVGPITLALGVVATRLERQTA